MKKVFITTLGCKVNQFESAAFKTAFQEAGCTCVESADNVDIVVINSCAVTAKAGAESRRAIRQAIRRNPVARIVITGCYAELEAETLSTMDELHGREFSIIGNSVKDQLVSSAMDTSMQQLLLGSISKAEQICRLPVRHFGERTRAYLRVQDGCESFCTYCIVPFTRGPSRSLPLDEVRNQARIFSDQGFKEIVLTGIHLGHYGRDLTRKSDITELVDCLTQATPDIRYRISSLEPTEISDQLLELMKERTNLMPHFHIPLQSGDDTILDRMNRQYDTQYFSEVIQRCRSAVPNCGIGIDVLAGFPGENDLQFDNTRNFLESLDFTYLHVFPYSKRPGTKAAEFKGEVHKSIKDKRVAVLRAIGDTKRQHFHQNQLGSTVSVLIEGSQDSSGLYKGFSDNYLEVHLATDTHSVNTVVEVNLTGFHKTYLTGEALTRDEG